MSYIRKTIDELTPRFGGVVRLARKDLGITAFGCHVFELPPNAAAPGTAVGDRGNKSFMSTSTAADEIEIDGLDVVRRRTLIHVAPEATRQPRAGADGLTYLCVGGVPETTFRPNIKFD